MDEPEATLSLWDWRRQVADLYADVRAGGAGDAPWHAWRERRDELFREHPQSPIPAPQRRDFAGLAYFPYDPRWRIDGVVEATEPLRLAVAHSSDGETPMHRFGRVHFVLVEAEHSLDLFWLEEYSGGVFLPFRDATCGRETYGGGRYLLDTAKGADLGHDGTRVTLDFNYAYHPSCVHDPQWSCPLAPPSNRLPIAVTAGERL